MLPCDNSVIGGDMLSNQKPCSCILIFLARLPISLGCFSVSHPQSCAERPEGPSLPCYTTTAATRTHAPRHTHSHRHTPLLPLPSHQAGYLTKDLSSTHSFLYLQFLLLLQQWVTSLSPFPVTSPPCGSEAPSHEHTPPGSSAMETLHWAGIQSFHEEGVATFDFGREGCFLVGWWIATKSSPRVSEWHQDGLGRSLCPQVMAELLPLSKARP